MTSRVLFRDVKPFAVPDRLSDLRGPSTGFLELGPDVYWAPGSRVFALADRERVKVAYMALLSEADLYTLARTINPQILTDLWAELLLPQRVQDTWQARFPELIQ